MTKKKLSSPADDLLESLLEDVKQENDVSEYRAHALVGVISEQEDSQAPVGLPSEHLSTDDLSLAYQPSEPISEYKSSDNYLADPAWEELNYQAEGEKLKLPDLDLEKLDIPEIQGHYQSNDDILKPLNSNPEKEINLDVLLAKVNASGHLKEPTEDLNPPPPPRPPPAKTAEAPQRFDETLALNQMPSPPVLSQLLSTPSNDPDRTVAVSGFAQKKKPVIQEKVVGSSFKVPTLQNHPIFTSVDASLVQAETLKFAQQRILQLEKEIDRYRQENDDLATAAEMIKFRADELENKLVNSEKERTEIQEQAHSEILILKGNLQNRDHELGKAKVKIDELDGRLKSDFKKIRAKERELENRLELIRAEKQALLHAKDDNILDLQRRMDQMKSELDNYRVKIHEMNKSMESQNEQIRRTVRALRLALTNLESKGENPIPLKKAE